jgi:hypothetical protein
MKKAVLAASFGLAAFCFNTAFAQEAVLAQLSDISGNVLVDQGSGFAPAAGGIALKPGDRIMVPGKGGATLTFGPGCAMTLPADSMTTYTGKESCTVGTQGTPGGTPKSSGVGVGVVLGGALILGGGALILNSTLNDENPPPQS